MPEKTECRKWLAFQKYLTQKHYPDLFRIRKYLHLFPELNDFIRANPDGPDFHIPPDDSFIYPDNYINTRNSGQRGATNTPQAGRSDNMDITTPRKDMKVKDNKYFHQTIDVERNYCELANQNVSFSFEVQDLPTTPHRDWTNYNQAQTNEADLFDELLMDLCKSIPEPEQKTGRPRKSNMELTYYAIKKIYLGLSSRRAKSMFPDDAPHFNMISRFLMRKEATEILHELIRLSSLPLADIEEDFAVDSTGFRTSSFGEYCRWKHKMIKKHKWLKLHVMTGVKTNIITSVEVTDKDVNDNIPFKDLVERTADGFKVREVSADKAYLSKKNYQIIKDVGGEGYIPFKKNSTGRAHGSPLWKKMYHRFQLEREEFDKHYHKRSNVESTIGAIKKKFGETLKSKDRIAQENELLCKILAYNITVLIKAMYENNIEIMAFT